MKTRAWWNLGVLAGTLVAVSPALAAVTTGVGVGSFAGAHVERFDLGADTYTNSHSFANGLSYGSLTGPGTMVSHTGFYGLGDAAPVSQGKDADRYFAVAVPGDRFAFSFAGGVNRFGFYGAEADESSHLPGSISNAVFRLAFYDTSNNLLDTVDVASPASTFAWSQFHGFYSSTLIGRVEFVDNGYFVMDNMMFEKVSAVPEPQAWALALTALLGLGALRRRRAG
jgi:MYXO-CTERM domain-containing protein